MNKKIFILAINNENKRYRVLNYGVQTILKLKLKLIYIDIIITIIINTEKNTEKHNDEIAVEEEKIRVLLDIYTRR